MPYVHLVTLLALAEYAAFILLVGGSRGRYNVDAPATTGNPQWERYYRIQVNTAEQLVLFLPALYGFAFYVSPIWAAGMGAVFLVGRIVYFAGYSKSAELRLPGAIMSSFTSYIMVVGALIGVILKIIESGSF